MANKDRPRGAYPTRNVGGGKSFATNEYSVDASNGTAIFPGDFVQLEADGNVTPATAGTGVEILGVVAGVVGRYDDLSLRYLPASTAGTVSVYDDPYTMFAVQEDDGGTALTAAARGANVAIIAGAGSTTTSISAHELDQDSVVATTEQLRLVRLIPVEDNAYGDNADWEVLINEHEYKQAVGT
jgi:hypothetical protein